MEHLIAVYLFTNKECPLPGCGNLMLTEEPAAIIPGEKKILPPCPIIKFTTRESNADPFIQYISSVKRISDTEARDHLNVYCTELNNMDAYSETEIPSAGKFYNDAEGKLVFKQGSVPQTFLTPVNAERVIHPEASHKIMVGDKESDSAYMTEYYREPVQEAKSKWWLWAVVLFVIGMIFLILHFANNKGVGNTQKVVPVKDQPTYTVPQ